MQIRKGLRSERGASTVEFALLLPVLVLLLFGIFEFGLAYNSYLAVTHAAREGARMAAVGAYNEGTIRDTAYPARPTSITVSYPNGNAHGETVAVTVRAETPIQIPLWGSRTLSISSTAKMRIEV